MLRNLVGDMRATHEEHMIATEDFYRYKAIMCITPSNAIPGEIDEATVLKDSFENAINYGDPGEYLTKKTRFTLYALLLLIETAIMVFSLIVFDKVLPAYWNIPAAILVTFAVSVLLDVAFFRWVYNPIGKVVLNRRISRLDFWSAVATQSIVA
jgi:hypothetical protein